MYEIPILFVIFTRKEISIKSFEKIKDIKPLHLYIAQDGPRSDNYSDRQKILETRNAILSMIDWTCNVHTLFQKENLGCGKGVFSAISWLFENEEMGIILEDDCVAEPSFFDFVKLLLNKYRCDQRIGMIAGSNLINGYCGKYSYHFSRFKNCWGWATWKRAWKNMDMDMNWRKDNFDDVINNSGFNGKDYSRWLFQLKCIDKGIVSAWDWQWFFSLAAQNQLCVYPAVNLVSNIGDDSEATHTSHSNVTVKSYQMLFPLNEPHFVVPDYSFEKLFYKQNNTLLLRLIRIVLFVK